MRASFSFDWSMPWSVKPKLDPSETLVQLFRAILIEAIEDFIDQLDSKILAAKNAEFYRDK